MANKGPEHLKLDPVAMNEIIVFANQYRQDLEEKATEIATICKRMEEEESLKGGDGDLIRENFAKISVGCTNIKSSTERIITALNAGLEKLIEASKGRTVASAAEKMQSATQKAGVLKE
jgi:hypothetical protein